MRAAVIGAGSWGTAVSCLCGRTADTRLWARRPAVADAITANRHNPDYLLTVPIPDSVTATSDLDVALSDADVVVIAVPSHGFRDILEQASPFIAPGIPILSVTKGIERGTLLRMTEVISEVLPTADPPTWGCSPDRTSPGKSPRVNPPLQSSPCRNRKPQRNSSAC